MGTIAYRTGPVDQMRKLAWYDRSGTELELAVEPDASFPMNPSLSLDGCTVALSRSVGGNTDIWLLDVDRRSLKKFTFDAAPEIVPVWSPDGNEVLYSKGEAIGGRGVFGLYRKARNESGAGTRVSVQSGLGIAMDWSRDGRFLLFRTTEPMKGGWDVWAVAVAGEGKAFPVLQSSFDERSAQFSPDGRWLAYESNESGQYQIHVQPFPGPGEQVSVSTGGGIQPRWSFDGRELFYIAPDGHLMAVSVRVEAGRLGLGAPVRSSELASRATFRGDREYVCRQQRRQSVPDQLLRGATRFTHHAHPEPPLTRSCWSARCSRNPRGRPPPA